MRKPTVIFDLDGTLADISHRRPFLEQAKPHWAAFNAAMGEDTPNAPVVALYQTLYASGAYHVLIVSGREEVSRKLTEQWLTWHNIPFDTLLMRPNGDYRPDWQIKEDILHSLQQQGHSVLFTVDDRDQVVAMWRRHGITCLQCAEGQF